jgi:hypothetical protein
MKLKALAVLPVLVMSAASVLTAHAATLTGGIGASGSGEFTSSSLVLNASALTGGATGDLVSADDNSITTLSTAAITGLSSTSLTLTTPIQDYFEFSVPGLPGSTGTTPANRFDFELTSITETFSSSATGDFSGTGVLTDSTGAFDPTVATFTLAVSGGPGTVDGQSFTLTATGEAVPEPSSWALGMLAFGAIGLLGLRQRRA